jgi:hypothetical protein
MYFSGETRDLEGIVDSLIQNNGYYESGLRKTHTELKFALYERVKPAVIALGSSHVLQIRGEYFDRDFINMGSTMQSLGDGINIVNRLFANKQRPEVIILGIDYHWFFEDKSSRLILQDEWMDVEDKEFFTVGMDRKSGIRILSIHDVTKIWRYLKAVRGDRISLRRSLLNPGQFLGLRAILRNNGFDRYGKYHYNYRIYNPGGSDRSVFVDNDADAERYRQFASMNTTIAENKWEQFLHLRKLINDQGVKLITIILPNSDWATKRKKEAGLVIFVNLLETRINSLDGSNYSYWGKYGDNCEFIDEGHPGEITMMRILKDLLAHEKVLPNYIDHNLLDAYIQQYSGMTTISTLNQIPGPELDFNVLNCPGKG